jgi:hypothetical protein
VGQHTVAQGASAGSTTSSSSSIRAAQAAFTSATAVGVGDVVARVALAAYGHLF